jgi:glycosyltransferase involved in cell wall biosynthesis
MKKVLFLGRFPPPVHGAAVMNQNYFEALNKDKDFNVKKIKINYSDSLDELGKVNFKKFFGFFVVFLKTLFNLIFFRPNVVYFELAPKGFAFYRDSAYVILCKIFRRKIVFHLHAKGVSEKTNNSKVRRYYRFIFKNTKIILLSDIFFGDIKVVARKQQIEILPNGIKDEITDEQFRQIIKKRNKNKKPTLLFLSNMIESKGPLDVLKICNELNKEKRDFECNFVGKFQDEEFRIMFEKKLKEFGLEKKCKYLGPKYGEHKKKILEKTDFLVFPTNYAEECFPLVILESFMYGISAFSYNNGAVGELISKDYLGYVSEGGDWKKLERELRKRINRKKNQNKIRREFDENYKIETAKQNFINILNKFLASFY